MGEEARGHRLEQDERGAGNHEDVEDEPGRRRPLHAADDQRPGVQEALLAGHDQEHRGGEPTAVRQGELRAAGLRFRARDPAAPRPSREGEGHHGQAENGCGDDPQRDHRLPARDPDRDRQRERHAGGRFRQKQGSVKDEAPAPGQKSAREEAGAER